MTSDPREATALVGRDAEMSLLEDVIGDVASGSSALLRVSGPAGVGKSRLCRDAQLLAEDAGFVAIASRPSGSGEELPFGAAVQALEPLLRARTESARRRLMGDLPQLGWLFAGMGLQAAAPLGGTGLQRLVLLEELCRLVERVSRDGPLLWAVDGLDAVDPSSAELLHRLVAILADRPVLLVASVAEDADGPIERACADFGWRTERIALRALAEPDEAALAEQVLSRPMAAPLRQAIHRRCVGTPLWVVATAQALVDGGRLLERDGRWTLPTAELPLPARLDDQLRQVVDSLDAAERAVLQALSVGGEPLSLGVLGHCLGVEAAAITANVATLERRRLIGRAGDGYSLIHGLLQEVVLTHLADTERLWTHAALARALRSQGVDDPRIAEHVLLAGPLAGPDLVPYELIRGGRRARAVGATDDAFRYLSAAIAALRDRTTPDGDRGQEDADLILEVADLAEASGHRDDARTLWANALIRCRASGRRTQVATVHRRLAMLDWAQGDGADAERHLDAADAALARLPPGPELGEVHYARTMLAQRRADAAAVLHQAGKLREIAGRIGSPLLRVRAELAAAAYSYARTDYVSAVAHNRAALRAADGTADTPLLIRVHDQTAVVAAAVGDMAELRVHSVDAADAAERAGLAQLAVWPRERLVVADLMAGRLGAALRLSADLMAMAERYGPPRGATTCLAVHALLLTYRGRLREARSLLARSRRFLGDALVHDRNVATIVEFTAGTLALATNHPDEAVRVTSRLADPGGGWMPLLSAALLAEAHAACGHAADAERIGERIAGVASSPTGLPQALTHWIRGLASSSDCAEEHYGAAARGFEELGLQLLAHRALLEAAVVGASHEGGRARSARLARRALDFFEQMQAPAQVRRARQVLRTLGVRLARRSAPAGSPALSDREMEVARLVAQGMSNAAVATELFISPRTVTTHLEHIYAKLSLSSRVALTRYLTDADLLETGAGAPASNT